MCGITGIQRFDGQPVDISALKAMTSAQRHRGPDDSRIWVANSENASIGLGHTRLSIIDLAGSPQPMLTRDGRYCLVYNGEIFNYMRLREQLDYPFVTAGDTEVLLAGLTVEGPMFLDRVRGQFAFGLVDTLDGSVLLGRDPIGVLPLHYHLDRHRLLFGSEVKSLLPALQDTLAVDTASLDSFLAHNSVHAPYTLFEGVRKLLPGHVMRVEANGATQTTCYWRPPAPAERLSVSPATAVELVGSRIRAAVREALVADVPAGAYLSGGLDSSLICSVMRRLSPEGQIETFSAGFGDPRFDELPYARVVADALSTTHHEVHVTADDFMELWPLLTWYRDAPLSQPADVAVYRLANLARQRVKVVLSGEGSDEIFAGYRKYRYARVAESARRVPGAARMAILAEPRLPARMATGGVVLRAMATPDENERLDSWFAPFSAAQRAALVGPHRSTRDPRPLASSGDIVRRMLERDLLGWLPDNLLERGDRMSMAASLELRPPFLDRDLVDLAFRLPSDLKVRRGTTKWVVRKVAAQYLPAEIINRAKVGFRVPLDTWFRRGLRSMAHDVLLSPNSFATQVFDRRHVQELLKRHDNAEQNEEKRIWTLVSLEVWHGQYFGSKESPTRG